jgi:hypothetical protein
VSTTSGLTASFLSAGCRCLPQILDAAVPCSCQLSLELPPDMLPRDMLPRDDDDSSSSNSESDDDESSSSSESESDG